MNKLINPTEELSLSIEVEGKKKKIKVAQDKYYILERSQKGTSISVLKHDQLIKIADDNGYKVDKTVLEFGAFNNPKNFCFIHRSYGTLVNGTVIDEVGEANPSNLDTFIASQYPAIMSNKRAQDRLLIRLMGLEGQVYSDVEFNSNVGSDDKETAKNEGKPKEDKANERKEAGSSEMNLTLEEAKNLIVDYGRYKTAPITLADLKEKQPGDFDWLCHTYKANKKSSEKMLKLHNGAILLNAETPANQE